jgi:hypothetical protein
MYSWSEQGEPLHLQELSKDKHYPDRHPRSLINEIEHKWVHSKRTIVEPARLLITQELKQRVCDDFDCELLEPLTQQIT